MTRVPNIANWGVFPSERILMLAMVAAADSASTVRKKYSVFIYSEAEPHAMYAIYKQTLTLCVLLYICLCVCVCMCAGYNAKACPSARGKLDSKKHSFGQVHGLI